MQLAVSLYREAGGGYTGPRTTAQRSLSRWTAEKWTTATGKKACGKTPAGIRRDRYLPSAAWKTLTPAQVKATRRVKQKSGAQYVPNEPAAREAGRKARRVKRG